MAASRAALPSFLRGTGATCVSTNFILGKIARVLTSSIFLDIEAAEKSNSLIAPPATLNLIAGLNIATVATARRKRDAKTASGAVRKLDGLGNGVCSCRLAVLPNGQRVGVHTENTAGTTKLVIDGAKVDLFNPELAKKGRAHDAGLHGNVEDTLRHNGPVDAVDGENLLPVRVKMSLFTVLVALVGRKLSGQGLGEGVGHFGHFRLQAVLVAGCPSRFFLGGCQLVLVGCQPGLLVGCQPSRLFLFLAVRQGLWLETEAAGTFFLGVGKEGGEGHVLGVSGAIAGDVGGIHSPGNDLAVVDQNATNRGFVDSKSEAGLAS